MDLLQQLSLLERRSAKGGNDQAYKGGTGLKWDKRDNTDNRNAKDLPKCCNYQCHGLSPRTVQASKVVIPQRLPTPSAKSKLVQKQQAILPETPGNLPSSSKYF
jgi:hypothetical protein